MSIKKTLVLLLMILYWYSQSIFSHLVVLSQHHDIVVKEEYHIHGDEENHKHSIETKSCKGKECNTSCDSIESSKLVFYSKSFSSNAFDIKVWNSCFKTILASKNLMVLDNDMLNVWLPIPIETLMPRIWPVVRII